MFCVGKCWFTETESFHGDSERKPRLEILLKPSSTLRIVCPVTAELTWEAWPWCVSTHRDAESRPLKLVVVWINKESSLLGYPEQCSCASSFLHNGSVKNIMW